MTTLGETGGTKSSNRVRDELVRALDLDLVGPSRALGNPEEKLPGWVRPSNWYLTGFLIPRGPRRRSGATRRGRRLGRSRSRWARRGDQRGAQGGQEGLLPLLDGPELPRQCGDELAHGHGALGRLQPIEMNGEDGKRSPVWQRLPAKRWSRSRCRGGEPEPVAVPESERAPAPRRRARSRPRTSRSTSRRHALGLGLPRQPPHARAGTRRARRGVRLPARDRGPQRPPLRPAPGSAGRTCRRLGRAGRRSPLRRHAGVRDRPRRLGRVGDRGRRMPRRCAPPGFRAPRWRRRRPWTSQGVELSMDDARALADGAAAEAALEPLVAQYRAWIEARQSGRCRLSRDAPRDGRGTASASPAWPPTGSSAGSQFSRDDADALDAFRVANRAVARALRQAARRSRAALAAFQLAFMLLNLPGLADPTRSAPRDGGPALLPDRRRQDRGLPRPRGVRDGPAPAAQSGRRGARGRRRERRSCATRCGCSRSTSSAAPRDSSVRSSSSARATSARYGDWPFEIGLWVGKAATPNVMGRKGDERLGHRAHQGPPVQERPAGQAVADPARELPVVRDASSSRTRSRCCPTTTARRELRIVCANFECDFTRRPAAARSWPWTSRSTAGCPPS